MRIIRLLTVVAILVGGGAMLSSCVIPPPPGGTSLTITAYTDTSAFANKVGASSFDLDNSWGSPGVPILTGHVNSCVNTFQSSGYAGACRVVNGYNEGGSGGGALHDHTDWDIKIVAGHPKAWIRDPGYGYQLATYFTPYCQGSCSPNHTINEFEGCRKIAAWDGVWPLHSAATSTDEYVCDYAVYDWAFTQPANPAAWWEHVASALWPSNTHHTADDAACGWAVGALTAGDVAGFLATVYGCVTTVQLSGKSANAVGGTDSTGNVSDSTNVLPDDPAQPGDSTPSLPAGPLNVPNPAENP
jgi:hypothetical protein